jgi:Tfp pilus assembly protein PilX
MANKVIVGNQDGVVLVLTVFLIAVLSLLGVAANRNVAIDTSISSNHLASVQSFYIAEAGLERGEIEAAKRMTTYDWATFTSLLDGTHTTPLELAFNTATPFATGSYTVTIANDPGDTALKVDTNRVITVRSTGTCGTSTSSAAATIRMFTAPKLPGAVNFVRDADITIGGDLYKISGHDYTLGDQQDSPSGSSPVKPGIALCDTLIGGHTVSSVRNIINKNYEVNGSIDVATSDQLTEQGLNDYIGALKPLAGNLLNCTEFGVTYVSSDLTVNCSAGKGLLIVDGNLEFLDNATWQGVIIVRGGTFKLDGHNNVRGGVIIETPVSQNRKAGIEIGATGKVALLYSQEAINNANGALTGKQGKWRVLSWRRTQ